MPLVALVQALSLALFAVLLVAAAVQDLRTMRIANGIPISIAAAFVVFATAGLVSGRIPVWSVGMAMAGGALVLAGGVAAFATGALGGGDVKLLAASSLFAGVDRLFDFLAITALVGGALAIAVLAGAPIGQPAGVVGRATLRARLQGRLPYGPAIAVSGLWVAAASVGLT